MNVHRRHRKSRWTDPRGSALLISLLVMVVVTLLGITYLFQADTENQIAANERDRAQVLGIAEAGARMIKEWYDRPILGDIGTPSHRFLNTYDLRMARFYDRDQRLVNHDGDPNTAPLASGDAGWVRYMQGFLAPGSPTSTSDPNHALTFMQKPYRGNYAVTLMGTEAGPDISIREDSASSDVRDFLAALNNALFGDTRLSGRITSIELYEPPRVRIGGTWERYGIGTAKVTAAKFRPATGGGEEKIAERVVTMVLNETPYPGPAGPLQSCLGIETSGSFEAHWGTVTGVSDIELNTSALDTKWDSAIPLGAPYVYLDCANPAGECLDDFTTTHGAGGGTDIEDPWLYVRTLASFVDAPSTNDQAWPYNPATYNPDRDHSNLVQNDLGVVCPSINYGLWREIALAGGDNIHYLTHAGGQNFQLNGIGTAQDFLGWVHEDRGFFFFETANRRPPDGTNLTPGLQINGDWFTQGFIFLNAANFRTTGMSGEDIAMVSPGEPYYDRYTGGLGYTDVYNAEGFTDSNLNKVWDVGEPFTDDIPPAYGGTDGVYDAEEWVNLDYGTSLGGGSSPPPMRVKDTPGDETNTITLGGVTTTRTTSNARDRDGLPVQAEVNLQGVMFSTGKFSAQGNAVYYGAVVTQGGVGEQFLPSPPGGAGNPTLYFDESLVKGEWPPPELGLPLTMITVWQTD